MKKRTLLFYCGLLLFSRETQDVHAGGSGCGCSAAVLCGHVLRGMREDPDQRGGYAGARSDRAAELFHLHFGGTAGGEAYR